ncbi:V-set and immunoglobulin domain-containing protein 10-like [Brachionichthys hirsutus]|uniref:V-set and immunoglobulin domain-containing protein 10-like n=1 Tax=Brachionichthys hirsutus TaxID=412623 RepID=UPI0036048DDE
MTCFDHTRRSSEVFLCVLLSFAFQAAHGQVEVSPVGPTQVDVEAGRNVTLDVSIRGATDGPLTWFMGDLPVVTWTIASADPPTVAEGKEKALVLEQNGSLTLVEVTVTFTSNYTVTVIQSGVGTSSVTFTLRVFESIENVSLRVTPDLPVEGSERFALRYAVLRGVVERQTWFFNGAEIKGTPRYSVENQSLVIRGTNRSDAGRYAVILTNPFGDARADRNIAVLYGPDQAMVEAHPDQAFYVAGDSVILSCRADGFPKPTVEWTFGGRSLSVSAGGILNLTNVQAGQGGTYTCTLLNEETRRRSRRNATLNVYEKPPGSPVCSVQAANDVSLRYDCRWLGGAPQARLTFPALSNTSGGGGAFNLTVDASDNLDGKTITCAADHQLGRSECDVAARSPANFLPAVRTEVDDGGKIAVTIQCVSAASPKAVVSWFRGSEEVANGTDQQISGDATQLRILSFEVGRFVEQNYTCSSRNPLGSRTRAVQLTGPAISDSSLFPNQDGSIITLTWEVPSTSIVTGFDIQLKGPDLLSDNRNVPRARRGSSGFRTIQQKPGSSRSTDVFGLDPDLTYRFRVIPKARSDAGEPSELHRIGPGDGLSGSAVAGIAAGIPCGLLFLLLLGALVYLSVSYCRKRRRQPRYPAARAAEKAVTSKADMVPHNLLAGGLRSPPDYNRLQKTPSERSVTLPSFVPPPPVRVATTV